MTGKENKDASSYPGPCPELLTQVTVHTAQGCLWPFPRRNTQGSGVHGQGQGPMIHLGGTISMWKFLLPISLVTFTPLNSGTSTSCSNHRVGRSETKTVVLKSRDRAQSSNTAEPRWLYLHLIPLPCEARAQHPLSDSIPNSRKKQLVVRVAVIRSPCPHIPALPSGTVAARQG